MNTQPTRMGRRPASEKPREFSHVLIERNRFQANCAARSLTQDLLNRSLSDVEPGRAFRRELAFDRSVEAVLRVQDLAGMTGV